MNYYAVENYFWTIRWTIEVVCFLKITEFMGILMGKLVRERGLEPPRLAAPDPKSGASASSATPA